MCMCLTVACVPVCRDTYVQQEAGESPNDRNDRAIRVAAAWYTARLPGQKIILLTDDADNRRKAGEMGVEALGSAAYAKQRAAEQPELQDLVTAAAAVRDEAGPSGAGADGPGGRTWHTSLCVHASLGASCCSQAAACKQPANLLPLCCAALPGPSPLWPSPPLQGARRGGRPSGSGYMRSTA